jgi:hypothetical protein
VLAPNEWRAVDVAFTGGRAASPGRVALYAALSTNAAVKDSGWTDVSTAAPAAVDVSPDGNNVVVVAAGGGDIAFWVANTGATARTFTVSATCAGAAFATLCAPSTSSLLTLSPGSNQLYRVTFTAGAVGTTGRIRFTASQTSSPARIDTGWVNVSVVASQQSVVAVTPDATTANTVPGAATALPFRVQNAGTATVAYTLAASCSGAAVASSCAPSQTSLTLSAGQSFLATVNYTAGSAATTGRVALTATIVGSPTLKDSGWVNVSTGTAGATTVAVTPDNNATSATPNNNVSLAFLVQNTGDAAGTFNITAACTGSAIGSGCTPSPATLPLGAGESKEVRLDYTAGASNGSTGRIRLLATLAGTATVSDSGWASVVLGTPTIAVAPRGNPADSAFFVVGSEATASFTVTNQGQYREAFAAGAVCTGTAVGGACNPSPVNMTLDPQQSQNVTVRFTPGAVGSTGMIKLRAGVWPVPLGVDSGSVPLRIVAEPTPAVAVAPHDSATTKVAQLSATVTLTVKNSGTGTGSFDLANDCTWAGVSIPCTRSPQTIGSLGAGATQPVTITFTAGTPGTQGTVKLVSNITNNPALKDSGVVTVTSVADANAPTVAVANLNSGSTIERDLCLTVALGSDAAYECGDLRLVHSLPTVRTLNKVRAPALLYNSQHAHPFPLIAADIGLPAGAATPQTMEAVLTIAGVQYGPVFKWTGTDWTPGLVRRVTLGFDALSANRPTGVYDYLLEVRAVYADRVVTSVPTNAQIAIVNRSGSAFGAGWWLAGLEQLDVATMVWVGGDGSVRKYLPTGTANTWSAAAVDRPDTLKFDAARQRYLRLLPDSARVEFDVAGRHVATVNRLHHETTFLYVNGNLSSMTVPPASAGKTYTFDYVGTVMTVHAPAIGAQTRNVVVAKNAGNQVLTITDPDNTTVGFGYLSGPTNFVWSRVDRRGTTTSFRVDSAGRLAVDSTGLENGQIIEHRFTPAETRGLGAASAAPSVLPDSAYTLLNGPRIGVNLTRFWLDRFGAPFGLRMR